MLEHINDLCVLDTTFDGLELVEFAPKMIEDEIRGKTEPNVDISSHECTGG